MGSAAQIPPVRKGDWTNLNRVLRKLAFKVFGPDSSPYFTGLNLLGDLDMNNNAIVNCNYIDFDLVNGVAAAEGRLIWNEDDGTLNLGLKGGTVNLQIGQEVVTRVKNTSGGTINDGEAVYVSGATGANVEVAKPIATNPVTAPLTFGLATETIDDNGFGYVTLTGNVRDVDTSGTPVSETWAAGDVVWLSATTAGALTNVRPTQPNIGVAIGVIVRAHATEGTIAVHPILSQRLSLLSDVLVSSIANYNLLQWDSGTGVWKNIVDLVVAGYIQIRDGLELRFGDIGNSNYVGFKAPALTADQIWTLPTADGSASDIIKTNGSGILSFVTPTVALPLMFDDYDAQPARASESNIHGALLSLATGQPLDSVPTDIVVTKGVGKVMVVVNAGGDIAGDITITGETIDRDTGASTPADTDVITVDALTTDGTTTDSNGNTVHAFTGAYVSSKWFTGTVTLSTADLTLTDVDVYHVSFEQFNDKPNIVVNTFDVNMITTSVNAEFDAYLYSLEVTGDKCNIVNISALHVGADGETAIANKYWRLRRGVINKALDGTTDGVWIDVHYSNTPADVEDVTIKVWATQTQSLTLT